MLFKSITTFIVFVLLGVNGFCGLSKGFERPLATKIIELGESYPHLGRGVLNGRAPAVYTWAR